MIRALLDALLDIAILAVLSVGAGLLGAMAYLAYF